MIKIKNAVWGTCEQNIEFSFEATPLKDTYIESKDFRNLEDDMIYDILTKTCTSYDGDSVEPNAFKSIKYWDETFNGDYQIGKTYRITYDLTVFLDNVCIDKYYENRERRAEQCVDGSYIISIDVEKLTNVLNEYLDNKFSISNVTVGDISEVSAYDVEVDEKFLYDDDDDDNYDDDDYETRYWYYRDY